MSLAQAATVTDAVRPRSVSRWTLLRVLWRSFFFQSAMNYERMQNVGFAYCILPALTRLYSGDGLKQAMARHLEFFNSHPYMVDALLGATVRLEVDVANGRLPPEAVRGFKTTMMGPMAAIGDSFFWASLKPFAATFAVAAVFSGVAWAPLLFLFIYNAFHLTLRIYGLFAGYRMGERVFEKLYQFDLVRFSDRSHYLAALCVGIAGAVLVEAAVGSNAALGQTLEPVFMVTVALIYFLSIKRRMSIMALLYGSVGLCVLLISLLNWLFPLL